MSIVDILLKRRKFIPVFESSWRVIGDKISLSADDEDAVKTHRELFYFVSIVYSTVYQAALQVGMSEGSAHHLARIQTKKTKIEESLVKAVVQMFSGPKGQTQKQYVSSVNGQIGQIVQNVAAGQANQECNNIGNTLKELKEFVQVNERELLEEDIEGG